MQRSFTVIVNKYVKIMQKHLGNTVGYNINTRRQRYSFGECRPKLSQK